jgi:diacylglycerol kinase (ATP)
MTPRVAVVAHRKKSLGGRLDELRRSLTDEVLWYEIPKSRKARKKARRAIREGADLIFVWGGDGMVQRCLDALAGADATVAILPAGTANLLAANLGIPRDLTEAVCIGLRGARRRLDLGRVNGEHFVVMAGAGFVGEMIRAADRELKDTVGRLAYAWTGLRQVRCSGAYARPDGPRSIGPVALRANHPGQGRGRAARRADDLRAGRRRASR